MENTKQHIVRKVGRILLWIFLGFVVVLMGAAILFFFKAEQIVNKHLSAYVYEKTDSTYRFNYDAITIHFKDKSISASNILLEPDSIHYTDTVKKPVYLKTQSLQINHIKFWPFLRDRRFVAESFKIERPELSFGNDNKSDLDFLSKYKLSKGDTLSIPIFAEIFLDTIAIIDAPLSIDTLFKDNNIVPAVNVVANHFKIGGLKFTDTPYPFDVSDLMLTIDNLNEKLPDQLHEVSVNKVSLSLLHSKITATDLKLSAIDDSLNNEENHYSITVPEIEVLINNITELNQFDTIEFKTVNFTNPAIQIKFGTKFKDSTPLNEINLYKLTGNTIDWIKVQQLNLNNATVQLLPSNSNEVAHSFEQLNIKFYDFLVDSTSFKKTDKILSANDLSFTIGKYTLNHNDKVHKLYIDDLKVETKNHSISSGEFSFKPDNVNTSQINTLINVGCKGISCSGVNFLQFYHQQQLPMKELLIKNPSIHIDFEQKHPTTPKLNDKSLILDKISDYLTGIYVDSTKISLGDINYTYSSELENEGFFKAMFSFNLINLSIDSTTFAQSDKIFFADDFMVHFEDLKLQLADETHRLTSTSIDLSSKDKSAEITDLRILPIQSISVNDSLQFNNKSEYFDIKFPKIKLSGANLHRAFFNKQLYVHTIYISNPTLNIEKFGDWKNNNVAKTPYQNALYAMVSGFLYNINIRNLNMSNGVLNLVQHRTGQNDFELSNLFSIKLTNFELNAKSSEQEGKLFFSDDIDLVLKDHSFTLADGVHKVDADEIGILSSQKKIYVKKAKLYPDILSKKFNTIPVSAFANIPDIQITDADIFGLMNKGHFPVGTITLNQPDIKLLFQKTETKPEQNDAKDKAMFILDDLKSVSANRININNGKLELAEYKDHKSSTLVNTDLNFTMDKFKVIHNSDEFQTSYASFNLDVNNWIYNFPDNIHELSIKKASYSLASENLKINDFEIGPAKSVDKTDRMLYLNFKVPEIEFKDFNFTDYQNTGQLNIEQARLTQPSVILDDKRIEKKSTISVYELDLYKNIEQFAKHISIGNITCVDAHYQNIGKSQDFNNIDLESTGFLIDKENSQKGKLLYSNSIKLNIKGLAGKTKGDFFEYRLDNLALNTNGEYRINGLSLKPLMQKSEFAQKKVYQSDYFDIENVTIFGSGLDLKELIENQNFYTEVLNAELTDVKIHRDKRYPLQPDLRKKLPQEALRDLKNQIHIDQASVAVDRFQFSEREPNATKNSIVFVTDATADIRNISNVREKLDLNPIMSLAINGNLMGIGETKVNMDMNVPSFGNEFTFSAFCGPMPLNALNPIAEPGLKLSIKEGLNQKMEVYFEANEDSASGNIRFAYNDLKISVLSNRDGELKEGKLISFLVNSIALKSDNPKPGRILMPAKFVNYRDKQKSVVGYCWRSIYSGIKSTLGIKEKEE